MVFNVGDRVVLIGSLTTVSDWFDNDEFRGEIFEFDNGGYWIRWLNNNQESFHYNFDELFELDKEYYRDIKLNEILN